MLDSCASVSKESVCIENATFAYLSDMRREHLLHPEAETAPALFHSVPRQNGMLTENVTRIQTNLSIPSWFEKM